MARSPETCRRLAGVGLLATGWGSEGTILLVVVFRIS
jgi:hypothetical protein